jgi:hypothetical protein
VEIKNRRQNRKSGGSIPAVFLRAHSASHRCLNILYKEERSFDRKSFEIQYEDGNISGVHTREKAAAAERRGKPTRLMSFAHAGRARLPRLQAACFFAEQGRAAE